MKRKNPYALHPVERAIAKARWESLANSADLHLSWGDNFSKVIDTVSVLLYITGLAAHTAKLVDNRITDLHNACTTAVDCVDGGEITVEQQETLAKGLEAVRQIKPLLPERDFVTASIQASCLIKSGGVFWKDFLVFIQH